MKYGIDLYANEMKYVNVLKDAYFGFETQRRRHNQKSKNRGISGTTKRLMSSKKILQKKEEVCNIQFYISFNQITKSVIKR